MYVVNTRIFFRTNPVHLEQLGQVLDTQTKRIGFRSVKLVQEPLAEPDQYGTGTTFLFEVNGVRMFMGGRCFFPCTKNRCSRLNSGSNWIPAHNFLTTITPERYRAWLTLLRDGNQNMVRLWGGGVYEPDIFYDICDGKLHYIIHISERDSSVFNRAGGSRLARLSIRLRCLPRARFVCRVGTQGS